MYVRNILVVSTFILCSQGFDIKLKYCRVRCSNACEVPDDKNNPEGTAKPPAAYYWRDFYGTIPTDAYPLGPSNQFPQTYIGLVFDPSKNGTFISTIYDGLDYVYTTRNNETTQINKQIQILCTLSPGELSWIKLTSDNFKTMPANLDYVRGGFHVDQVKKTSFHYIVKTSKCSITYAGAVSNLNVDLEYAKIDGTSDTTDQYLWLMYKKEESANDPKTSGPSSSKSFFSHKYEYKIRPNSIVPQFYKQITVGSCSLTCTNENQKNSGKIKKDDKLAASMAYYWKPKQVVAKEEALVAGKDDSGDLYVGKTYSDENALDVGSSNLMTVSINFGSYNVATSKYYQVLSSNYPYKFKWVNTTAQDFSTEYQNNIIIPGGAFYNGTDTFVCRENFNELSVPGSARRSETGTYCHSSYGPVKNYQVLIFDPKSEM